MMGKCWLGRIGLFLGLLCLPLTGISQQDPLYSQYHFNQLVLNPSYAGIYNNFNATFISRIQWALTGIQGTPITNSLLVQSSIVDNKLGAGLIVVQDHLGVARNYEIHVPVAYKISSGSKVFSFGLQPGLNSINYSYDQLTLRSSDDPAFQSNVSAVKPNIGAGISYMTDNLFVGFSVPRLLNSKFEENLDASLRYKRHYYVSLAYMLPVNSILQFKPSVLLRGVEGSPLNYDINALLLIDNMIWAGVYTRSFESLGILAQFDYKDSYRFGYNFEFPVNNSLPFSYSTHEFMISIDLKLLEEQDIFQRHF